MESAEGALLISRPGGRIEWVNGAFGAMSGYAPAEVIGQTPRLLKSEFQDQRVFEEMWSTLRSGGVWHGEVVNRRRAATATSSPRPWRRSWTRAATSRTSSRPRRTSRLAARPRRSSCTWHDYDALTDLPNRALPRGAAPGGDRAG